MKKSTKILWGIVLILLGVILALKSLNIMDINIFFDGWWTLIIIIPSLIGIFTDSNKMPSIISFLVGVVLLLCCLDILAFDLIFKLVVPAIVVIVGLKLIFGTFKSAKASKIIEENAQSNVNRTQTCATFSGQDVNYSGQEFYGTNLDAIFGGVNCDLRSAIIPKDCVIKVSAIFGGIDIFLPDNVNVKVNSNSFFGGISNKRHTNSASNSVTVYVEGMCLFGGVDIK